MTLDKALDVDGFLWLGKSVFVIHSPSIGGKLVRRDVNGLYWINTQPDPYLAHELALEES